jgi:aldose 1-epimerase
MADIALGYDSLDGYLADSSTFIGATVGRYANRIAHGRFSLNGHTYQIPANDGENALHGGKVGLDRKLWSGHAIPGGVVFTLVSPDGDMGFPGDLTTRVTYSLVGTSLRIEFAATTTKPTVVNFTNHTYFNLTGLAGTSILNHILAINAERYTPVDAALIPTGVIAPVAGTPLDFRKPTVIGARIEADNEQLRLGRGYDHNFVLNGTMGLDGLRRAAFLLDPTSGRTLTVTTTEPAVQFYSGNFLDGKLSGRGGARYVRRSGLCLETQHFPDSPNHPGFPSTLLQPGQSFHSTTVFTFGVEQEKQ